MTKTQTSTAAAYAISPELQKAFDAVESARAQCRKLAERVDDSISQIAARTADIDRLNADLGTAEAAAALAEAPEDLKRHEKVISRLSSEIEAKSAELRRTRTRVEALEGMGPDLDLAVKAAGAELEVAISNWSRQAAQTLAAEVVEAVKPLAAVMARAEALAVAGGNLKDFVEAAFVPSPEGFRRVWSSQGWVNEGRNLIAPEQTAKAEAIAEPLAAMVASARSARFHVGYVPLARRPKYQTARVEAPAAAAMAETS